jgi:CRISPR/Cas system-associated exonuclease Cas4 (RecB family)
MPDLIVFYRDKPPMIVDWKVEAPRYKEHRLQLTIYGYALSRVKPHKDFPEEFRKDGVDAKQIRLLEFQLLRNKEVEYALTNEDLTEIEDYIFTTSIRMRHVVNGSSRPEQLIDSIPKTRRPTTCLSCNFRKVCWRTTAS